jgi:hypothetical protein
MDLARAPRRAPLTARKKGSGYENGRGRDEKLPVSSQFRLTGKNYGCLLVNKARDTRVKQSTVKLVSNF